MQTELPTVRLAPSIVAGLPDLTVPLPDWHRQAVCISADPDIFFPEGGKPATSAVALCQVCPVQGDCLQDALEWEAEESGRVEGVRGGLSANERKRLHRKHTAAA